MERIGGTVPLFHAWVAVEPGIAVGVAQGHFVAHLSGFFDEVRDHGGEFRLLFSQ